jgi:predicted DNA binding protein
MRDIPEVIGYDVAHVDTRSFYVYVRDTTTGPLQEMFAPVTSGGILVVPPVKYEPDGTVVFSMFGPDDELQEAVTSVPSPIDVTVEAVGGLADTAVAIEAGLTDRQREIVNTAVTMGYYDIPRTASQPEIAIELDCAPSTVAEHLRKAESQIMRTQFS